MMKHEEFRKSGVVSVWVGNFRSDTELDEYMNLSREFEDDFGFEIDDRDTPEISVEAAPVPIAKLVDGFSWSDSYGASIANLAKSEGIEKATTMVVFLNFEYQPERAESKPNSQLKFLGTVRFPC
jgi:hypothetical protein